MSSQKFGANGEWWVIAQVILLPVALIVDYVLRDSLMTSGFIRLLFIVLSVLFIVVGGGLLFGGVFRLGSNLTAMPRPLEHGHLVQSGVYSIVRHPIYAGIIIGMFGVGLWSSNWVGMLFAVGILVFFDFKSRREEAWLIEKYPEYPQYRRQVRKLIPFIY